jgi:hypothetical protein
MAKFKASLEPFSTKLKSHAAEVRSRDQTYAEEIFAY